MNTLRYVLGLILGFARPYAVQRWDRGRLPVRLRAGTWNTASWASALYGFGPLSMIGWAWVTRHDFRLWWRRDGLLLALVRSAALLLAGTVAAALIFGVILGLDALLGWLLGAPE